MIELPILDEADQQFGAVLNNRRVTIRVRYNRTSERWSFDLSIDNEPVLYGRRVALGVDMLEAFYFGLGAILAYPVAVDAIADRTALPEGRVRLYHATPAEIAAI